MPRFSDLEEEFCCPHRDGCPYLEGLSTRWVWHRYQEACGLECQYEFQLEQLQQELDESHQREAALEKELAQARAQLHALHRRQFKARRPAAALQASPAATLPAPKKRGAPAGHPGWQRPKPRRVDQVVAVNAPDICPHCQQGDLQPVTALHEHFQEDIVLQPRTVVTLFRHRQAYCSECDRVVSQLGPGELPGAYIGPAAKATAAYLRYEMNASYRKISRFFEDFFGLKFVPASAYGFDSQAARRGAPLHQDLRQKIQALPVAHADETHWRHDGRTYWSWFAGDRNLAFFLFDPHRSSESAQSLLSREFKGILVADAYAAYNGVHPKDRQSCLSHIKRRAKDLGQELALLKGKARDPKALEFCAQVQGWVKRACQTGQQLNQGAWRASVARAREQDLREQLTHICRAPFKYDRAESFRQRLQGKEQARLLTFLRHEGVPPTNNLAEQSLRSVVIMRKVIQCTRSERGLINHSIMHSLKETARRQGKKMRDFFEILFTQDTAAAQAALFKNSS